MAFLIGQVSNPYNTDVKGEGIVEVATWNFKINGNKEQVQLIDLATTINSKTGLDHKIAPGTSGSFTILMDATDSEVGINYHIKLIEETNKPHNLKFIYKEKEYNSIQEIEEELSGIIYKMDENKIRTLTIQWEWKYETGSTKEEIEKNDAIDTQDSQIIEKYMFTICVSGEQI